MKNQSSREKYECRASLIIDTLRVTEGSRVYEELAADGRLFEIALHYHLKERPRTGDFRSVVDDDGRMCRYSRGTIPIGYSPIHSCASDVVSTTHGHVGVARTSLLVMENLAGKL